MAAGIWDAASFSPCAISDMGYEGLLAKSIPSRQGSPHVCLLLSHLQATWTSAHAILAVTGDAQLAAVGLNSTQYRHRLARIVLLGAAVHDLGKANDHFQSLVRGHRRIDQPQGMRHEWVTGWVLCQPLWQQWLTSALDQPEDWPLVRWAACGHHRQPLPSAAPEGSGIHLTVLLAHPDMVQVCDWLGQAFGLPAASPPLEDVVLKLFGGVGNVFYSLQRTMQDDQAAWRDMSPEDQRLLAVAKACLIAADVGGSSLPPAGKEPGEWIRHALSLAPSAPELEAIVQRALDGRALRPFQQDVAQQGQTVPIVLAGCGSGKTLGAYLWAARNHAGRRLYFCYPTTGTATEGFRDYLAELDLDARLVHSRAVVDMELILGSGDEPDGQDLLARLESIESWRTPVVSCTVDTVLGLIQNQRRGLYAWPALAKAAVVFDEIHLYDQQLFGALLRFLQACPGLPCLLMTASLPRGRLAALIACLEGSGRPVRVIRGPADLEGLQRYTSEGIQSREHGVAAIRTAVSTGQKVLVICNTVDRTMALAEELQDLAPAVYHSRFRYEDRVCRHRDVIDAFRRNGPALTICTQVAEVSLDISADLLVTDLAPIPALIQRLGRLNRRSSPEHPLPAKPFLLFRPPHPLPYTGEDLELAEQWLLRLGTAPLSQQNLADAWETLDRSPVPAAIGSAWLDGGPLTQLGQLREVSPGLTVLLAGDADAVRRNARLALRYALPMPPPGGADWKTWPQVLSMPVSPAECIEYDPKGGARWRRRK